MDHSHQTPLSLGFSRQGDWSGWPCPPLGDLPDPGMEPTSPALAGGFFSGEPPGKPTMETCRDKKEQSLDPLDSQSHEAERKKSYAKEYVLYASVYKKFESRQN